MKKIMLAAPALALAACGGAKTEEAAPADTAEIAADDNDTAEPVAAPVAEEEEPHDESVPHDH